MDHLLAIINSRTKLYSGRHCWLSSSTLVLFFFLRHTEVFKRNCFVFYLPNLKSWEKFVIVSLPEYCAMLTYCSLLQLKRNFSFLLKLPSPKQMFVWPTSCKKLCLSECLQTQPENLCLRKNNCRGRGAKKRDLTIKRCALRIDYFIRIDFLIRLFPQIPVAQ